MMKTEEILTAFDKLVAQTPVKDKEVVESAVEFFNDYFGLKDHPFTQREIGYLSDFSFALKLDFLLWRSTEDHSVFYQNTPFEFFKNLLKNMDGVHLKLFFAFVKYIEDRKGKKILCYGDGSGYLSLRLFQVGYEVTFAEINKISIAWMKYYTEKNKLPISILDLNQSDVVEEYDVIIIKDVLEHVKEPQNLVEKLKKKGRDLLISGSSTKQEDWLPMHFELDLGFLGKDNTHEIKL